MTATPAPREAGTPRIVGLDPEPPLDTPVAGALRPATGNRLDDYLPRYAARAHGMTTSEIRALFSVASRPEVVSLAGGMPNIADLPLDAVGQLAGDLISGLGQRSLQYGSGQGEPFLRELICDVMAASGISAHPDDVTVTVGSQQGLDLITRIFCDPGDVVVAEAPSYVGALGVFKSFQVRVAHVEMDHDGLIPERLEEALTALARAGRRVKFLYTIPNYHNPAGVSMADDRRARVAAICRTHGVFVVEDDPYGLLGFDGTVHRPLRADDPDNVLYLGSFSKTFAPGTRVGWVLAPHAVREKLVLAQESATLCPPIFSQYLIGRYLQTQDWMAQIKVFREMYRERRDAMLGALTETMPAIHRDITWTTPDGGFYVWLTLPEGMDSRAMQPRALSSRVAYVSGPAFFADGFGSRSMRLSYCFPPPDRIREGVRRLAGVIRAESDVRALFGATGPAPARRHPTIAGAEPFRETLAAPGTDTP
jgi:2-aminoadipate transaminase